MPRARARAGVLAILAALGGWRCAPPRDEPSPQPSAQRNLLLLTLDTTRADHLGVYGRSPSPSPTLDRLGKAGVVFDAAMTVAPLTLPSHSSIMTGLFPPHHGVRDNGTFYLDDRFRTLAEVLRDKGWRTGAFVSAAVLERKYGLAQGFEVYDEDFAHGSPSPRHEFLFAERSADKVAASALAWLESTPTPFFAWVHFYDPHAEYEPPSPFDETYRDRPYDGEIAFMDATIASILERLRKADRLDDTFVVAVGDHGESLGEHGEQTHGVFVYEATVRVPFVLAGPGLPAGKRINSVVRTVDLMPTVLGLLGVAAPDGIDGRSLVDVVSQGAAPAAPGYAEAELPRYHYGWASLASVRSGPWKLIDAPRPELYQLTTDPKELINLYEREPAVARDLVRQLHGVRDVAAPESRRPLDAGTEEKLRSLGYVSDTPPPADGPALDPKDMIGTHVRIQRGRNLLRQGRIDAAIGELTRIVEENPRSVATWVDLAQAYVRKRDFERARVQLDRARALAPDSAPILVMLAQVERQRGGGDAAIELFQAAIARDARSETALIGLAATFAERGELERARETAERALAIDARNADAMTTLGSIALRRSETKEAEEWFAKALAADPYHANAHSNAGMLRERAGDLPGALAHYEEAIRSTGSRADLHQLIGSVLARLDRLDDAETHLEEAIRSNPDLAAAHATLAIVADVKGQTERAIAENREAIRLDPRAHEPHGNLAVIFIRRGEFPAARRELEAALALVPDYPEGHSNLAVVALSEGNLPAARMSADRALALRPSYPEALTNRGIVAEREGDAAAAVEYHRRALAIAPDYVEARNNLATALARLGRHAEAARELETVLRERPNLASAHRDAAELYARELGDREAAREHYRTYLTLVPAGPEHDEAAQALAALGPASRASTP